MPVFGVVEVEAVELVDDLAHGEAGLHVVVQSIEDLSDDGGALGGFGRLELLQFGKQAVGGVVDKGEQVVSGDALGIGRSGAPLELFGDNGGVVFADDLELLILLIEDFKEEHPAELFQTLGVARDSLVLVPHDVADVFDDGGDVGHVEDVGQNGVIWAQVQMSANKNCE